MTDQELSALEEKAKLATPGPWRWFNRHALVRDCGPRHVVLTSDRGMDGLTTIQTRDPENGLLRDLSPTHSDPGFIAACSPDVILALIKELREARLQRDMARQAFGDALVEMGNRGSRFMDMVRNSKL